MSSSKDQINLPYHNSNAHLTGSPGASSTIKHEHLATQPENGSSPGASSTIKHEHLVTQPENGSSPGASSTIKHEHLATQPENGSSPGASSTIKHEHLVTQPENGSSPGASSTIKHEQLAAQPENGSSPGNFSTQKHEHLATQPSEYGSSGPIPLRILSKNSKRPISNFDLMSMAGELRNKVYAAVLASGNISILLLSKKIYAEAKPLIYKNCVLKLGRDQLYFGETFADAPVQIEGLSPMPTKEALPLIQNINIDIERGRLYRTYLTDHRLFWSCWSPGEEPSLVDVNVRGIMAPFMNTVSAAPRGTCEVILRNFDKIERGTHLMKPVFYALKRSDNFKKVILVITANRDRDDWVGWLDRARRLCMEELHESLGQATWHAEVETFDDDSYSNGYLKFYPRGSGTKAEGQLVTE